MPRSCLLSLSVLHHDCAFVLPVLVVSVVGHRSDALLDRLNGAITRHSRLISAIICFVFAGLLLYSAGKQWVS